MRSGGGIIHPQLGSPHRVSGNHGIILNLSSVHNLPIPHDIVLWSDFGCHQNSKELWGRRTNMNIEIRAKCRKKKKTAKDFSLRELSPERVVRLA